MTILDPALDVILDSPTGGGRPVRQRHRVVAGRGPVRGRGDYCARPAPARPRVAPLRYRDGGIALSRAGHPVRAVRTSVAVALATMTALITLWLGVIAQLSGEGVRVDARPAAPSAVPDRLGVVEMRPGETLHQLAARVAPQAMPEQVVDRIRELNKLGSSGAGAGQTLIAPLG